MDLATLSMIVAAAILIIFLATGIPIGVSLIICGVVGTIVFTGGRVQSALEMPLVTTVGMLTTYAFLVIPMFLLMGDLAASTQIAGDLFDAAYRWVGRIAGGLAVATVVTCAAMAAITGSSVGTAAAMTQIALPELKRYKYDLGLSIGVIAVGGTLAIMIPPSTMLVVYAIIARQSIGRLLMAGVFPGLLTAALYAIIVITRCTVRPQLGPPGPRFSFGEMLRSLVKVVPFVLLMLSILLGMLFGVWTPVEASAAGVIMIVLIAIAYRRFKFTHLSKALIEAVLISASVMTLVIGAMLFSSFTAMSGFNVIVTNTIVGWGLPPFALFSLLVFIYLIMGMFLEGTSMIVLTVPLLMPVIQQVGWDPVWFGVIMVELIEIAAVTPPVGLNLYAVKAVAPDVPLQTIYAGSVPFWLCNIAAIFLMYFAPSIALFLPNAMKMG